MIIVALLNIIHRPKDFHTVVEVAEYHERTLSLL